MTAHPGPGDQQICYSHKPFWLERATESRRNPGVTGRHAGVWHLWEVRSPPRRWASPVSWLPPARRPPCHFPSLLSACRRQVCLMLLSLVKDPITHVWHGRLLVPQPPKFHLPVAAVVGTFYWLTLARHRGGGFIPCPGPSAFLPTPASGGVA